jgi:glycosyltransferase involved in cell wall biosynthesis
VRIALFLPHLAVTGGLGVHCRTLLAALARVSPDDEYDVFAPARPQDLFPMAGRDDGWPALVAHPRVRFHPLDWPADSPLSRSLDPILRDPVAAVRPDVVYCSYYTGLEKPLAPQVVTFHDAGFLEFPDVFGETARQRRETVERVRPAIRLLHCVSADARERICRLLPFDPARTAVVWHALPDPPDVLERAARSDVVNGELWPGGDELADWGRYLFLPVGAATGFNRGRKNVPAAVTAFRRLGMPGVKLVVAGTGVLHERMLADLLPASEKAAGGVVGGCWRSGDGAVLVLPSLDRAPFLAALAHAAAVVYPSRYEGFGLPAIEAMAVGVPLVAGRATSLPEVVGDGGLLVDPDDLDELVGGMRTVLTDPAAAADLVRRGRERAKLFTLERMGQGMREAFDRVSVPE